MKIGYNLLNKPDTAIFESILNFSKNSLEHLHITFKYNSNRKNEISFFQLQDESLENFEFNKRSWLYEEIFLPFHIAKSKIDIFVGLNNNLPVRQPCKTLVLIKDSSFLIFDDEIPKSFEMKIKHKINLLSAKKANRIITFSEFSKDLISKKLNVQYNKIALLNYPISKNFFSIFSENKISDGLKSLNITQPYFLTHTTVKKKDNFKELLSIFENFLLQNNPALLIVKGLDKTNISKAKKLTQNKNIIFLEEIDDNILNILLNGASAFVSTSLIDTTCQEALQAMACGTPVICYKNQINEQILSKNAILIEQKDKNSFIQAMKNSINNINFKLKMKALGIQHSKNFSIESFSKKFSEILSKIYTEKYHPDEK